jgi:ubiquinone/menaquinone biosynthesis C-methylase UbiE
MKEEPEETKFLGWGDTKSVRDPEKLEVRALLAGCPLAGTRLLEIGCGNGKFTWQYAGLPARVAGIDPVAADLRQAMADKPAGISNSFLVQAVGEALPFVSRSFDIILFGSSL